MLLACPSARRWAPGAPAKAAQGVADHLVFFAQYHVVSCVVIVVIRQGPAMRRAVVVQEAAVRRGSAPPGSRAAVRTLSSTLSVGAGAAHVGLHPARVEGHAGGALRPKVSAASISTEFSAALLARYSEPPALVRSPIEPMREDSTPACRAPRHQRRDDRQQAHRRQHVGVHDVVEILLGREAVVARAVHAGHQPGVSIFSSSSFQPRPAIASALVTSSWCASAPSWRRAAQSSVCGRWRSRASRRRGIGAPFRGRCRARRQ
jgi:hypothetical protein